MIFIDRISDLLTEPAPREVDCGLRTRAAVALILHQGTDGPEVLFIVRATHRNDPWSGDIGFPGGKIEPAERARPRLGAERETLEEIGLDLRSGRRLGRLDDLSGAHLPIVVSCFVYALPSRPLLTLNHEVADAFWFPLGDLLDPVRHHRATVRFGGDFFERPAIRLLEPGKTVLWGITYRLVMQFLKRIGDPGDPLKRLINE